MNYCYDAILQAARYIEDNLTIDIKVQDIVKKVGFSQFHFMRVFKSISGHTINNYIKRRKITEAAKALLESNTRIIDIAVLYGYNSQEAFTRAFKEVYNVTPNAYRTTKLVYRNIEQIVLNENILNMKTSAIVPIEPRIVCKDDFLIAGMKYKGKNDNFEVPKLWNKLRGKVGYIKNRINEDICYGLESYNSDFGKTGSFEYIAGVEVSDAVSLPEVMELKEIDRARYAVFQIPAVIENVQKSISEIYSVHLPNTNLKAIGNYDFELYDISFDANNESSFISFYIPVE